MPSKNQKAASAPKTRKLDGLKLSVVQDGGNVGLEAKGLSVSFATVEHALELADSLRSAAFAAQSARASSIAEH